METFSILNQLHAARASIFDLHALSTSGIYALYLHENLSSIGSIPVSNNGLVYVGSTSDLAVREFDTHFNSTNTGFSTVRRSIGAILKDELSLIAIPRSTGASETNVRSYKFLPEGEDRLTQWMRSNLTVSVYAVATEYKPIEQALIARSKPVLNLKNCDNPYRGRIKGLRKVCADEARRRRAG